MRQIFLDTETTGFDFKKGNRMIEFGAIECIGRKLTGSRLHFHFRPDCEMEEGAFKVHGISLDFLADKPKFSEKVDEIMDYLSGAELVIHNAAFDVPFLDHEISLVKNNKWGSIGSHCSVLDTLILARKKHPGQRNSLDALCRRYFVSNAHRDLHGALLDSELLAKVYLAMTGGQADLMFSVPKTERDLNIDLTANKNDIQAGLNLKSVLVSPESLSLHEKYLEMMGNKSDNINHW